MKTSNKYNFFLQNWFQFLNREKTWKVLEWKVQEERCKKKGAKRKVKEESFKKKGAKRKVQEERFKKKGAKRKVQEENV